MNPHLKRIADWAHRVMPKREDLEHTRFVGPLARRHELWRFTRRSVPRGVAVGLLVGIFALIPGIQIIGAALLCVPSRGNIPLAALMTFLSNPVTTPAIIGLAIVIGNGLGFHADPATFNQLLNSGASLDQWLNWLFSDVATAMVVGLFVVSTIAASIGYLVAAFGWNWWVRHKRKVALDRFKAERSAG